MTPVTFIIGPGRSGTTLLYKILALHPAVAFTCNFSVRTGSAQAGGLLQRLSRERVPAKVGAWFGADGNAYRYPRSALSRLVALPVEGESLYARCGFTLGDSSRRAIDPETARRVRALFDTLVRASGADAMLSKRTANNRRVRQLAEAFPHARFVCLVRDGRAVAQSLLNVNWWNDHVVWWKGKTPRELVRDGMAPLAIAAQNWVEALRTIEAGLEHVAPDRVHRLRYEDLLAAPREHIEAVARFAGLPASAAFDDGVAALKITEQAASWKSRWSDADRRLVDDIQAADLRRYGYAA
jgi:hypothetical protein